MLRPNPAVAEVVVFDRTGGLREVSALRRALAGHRFDCVINCGLYFKSAIPTLLARTPHKLGFGRDRANDLVWLTANRRVPRRPPRHRQDMYLEFLDPLGVEAEPLEWRLTLTDAERDAQSRFFAELGGEPVVGVVATSSGPAKDWSVAGNADVVGTLARNYGFRVVVLGGPGDRETRRAREVRERARVDVVWALGPDLRRLLYLVDGCDLLIGPDTGPLHMARAVDTPVIGLYGHTDPRRSGPYGKYEDLTVDRYNFDAPGVPYEGPVERQHPARPGCRHGRMELISVADVLSRVDRAIDVYGVGERPRAQA